jgi:hypothetical protein
LQWPCWNPAPKNASSFCFLVQVLSEEKVFYFFQC